MVKGIVVSIAAIVLVAIPAIAQQASWLGITIEDQKDGGPIVRSVEPDSPAGKAGLKEGDVILEYNKENVIGAQQLTRLIRETPVGRTADLKIRRDNREQTVQVTTEAPQFSDAFGKLGVQVPDVRVLMDQTMRNLPKIEMNTTYVQSGIHIEQMPDQLRDFFGDFSNYGVLVTSVDMGSAGDKAGIKAGDVITAVNGKNIRVPADFSHEMRTAGGKGTLKIFRDKQEREINLN